MDEDNTQDKINWTGGLYVSLVLLVTVLAMFLSGGQLMTFSGSYGGFEEEWWKKFSWAMLVDIPILLGEFLWLMAKLGKRKTWLFVVATLAFVFMSITFNAWDTTVWPFTKLPESFSPSIIVHAFPPAVLFVIMYLVTADIKLREAQKEEINEDEKEQQIEDLKAKLVESSDALSKSQTDHARSVKDLTTKKKELGTVNGQVKKLTQQLNDHKQIKSDLDDLQARFSQKENEVSNLTSQLSQANSNSSELDTLRQEVIEYASQQKLDETTIEELRAQLEQASSDVDVGQIVSEKEGLEKQVQTLQSQLAAIAQVSDSDDKGSMIVDGRISLDTFSDEAVEIIMWYLGLKQDGQKIVASHFAKNHPTRNNKGKRLDRAVGVMFEY